MTFFGQRWSFGLGFDGCSRVDASGYRGISFTISGSVPQGSVVTMGVGTLNDTIASSWLNAHGGDGSVKPGRRRCLRSAPAQWRRRPARARDRGGYSRSHFEIGR